MPMSLSVCPSLFFLLQVETFGSMEKREKVEFILEQMRLCLAKKDYIRTSIISKKINTKFFDNDEVNVSIISHHALRFVESSKFRHPQTDR